MADLLSPALAAHGLILRGGFHPEPGEAGLETTGTVLLIGNAGRTMWRAFAPHRDGGPDPLNRWTRRVVETIADGCGARAVYPFGETLWPFQRWARRAEGLHSSPLGLMIHPEFGLWHAYRAALLFSERLVVPPPMATPSPCESCADKPCLSACPAGAFSGAAYDVGGCSSHLASADSTCGDAGCHARDACPIGRSWRYEPAQIRFHMAAFARAVAAP